MSKVLRSDTVVWTLDCSGLNEELHLPAESAIIAGLRQALNLVIIPIMFFVQGHAIVVVIVVVVVIIIIIVIVATPTLLAVS